MLKDKKERAKFIKIEFVKRDIKQKDLAKELGISAQTVSQVISGRDRSLKIEKKISDILGISIEELFGTAKKRNAKN